MEPPQATAPTYRNPILDADWPDPDAIRVVADYYLIASSFNRAPGLPVLHSTDLVNWTHIADALAAVPPLEHYSLPRHGSGVWAPSIRHHDGLFVIVYPDPDHGVFVLTAEDPRGPWSEPRLLLPGLGIIDPCPLWDDDGRTYLVHAWARSRSGRKNVLSIAEVDPDLTRLIAPSRDVIDGNQLEGYSTLEGPKFYKRDGWYWVFAPAGGVATGWQSAFRSRSVYGPYEDRVVMAQGDSPVNGPHQGAWVDAADGSEWFLHFQDRGAFGRVVHLQPLVWTEDGWPLIGRSRTGETAGEPVTEHEAPLGSFQHSRNAIPSSSDAFAGWRWQANPAARWTRSRSPEGIVLEAVPSDTGNLRLVPNVLGTQLPGYPLIWEVQVELRGEGPARAGTVVLGEAYQWVGLRSDGTSQELVVCRRGREQGEESVLHSEPWPAGPVRLRLESDGRGRITFHVARTEAWAAIGPAFHAEPGLWIGAEIGVVATAPLGAPSSNAWAAFAASEVERSRDS